MPPSASTLADGREPKPLGVPAQIAGFSIGGAASLALLYLYLSHPRSPLVDVAAVAICFALSAATVIAACTAYAKLKKTQARLSVAKHAAEAVQAQREAELGMFHVAVNNMSQGLCMFDANGRITFAQYALSADVQALARDRETRLHA